MKTIFAASGISRNQFIALGAIVGLCAGCTSHMAESAEFLARNQLALHAILPIVCFAISNFILVAVWKYRARMRPLLAVLATSLFVTLFVLSLWNLVVVKDSHDNVKTLPWPVPNNFTTFVACFVPSIIFLRMLTNTYFETRSMPADETRRSRTGAT